MTVLENPNQILRATIKQRFHQLVTCVSLTVMEPAFFNLRAWGQSMLHKAISVLTKNKRFNVTFFEAGYTSKSVMIMASELTTVDFSINQSINLPTDQPTARPKRRSFEVDC